MRIERVELKNIKPYRHKVFDFLPGINVLSGPNGVGKSTVFQAIGYALFGVNASRFIGKTERFVRKGQKYGWVRIYFLSDDNRRWAVERWTGASGKWRIAEKKTESAKYEPVEVKGEVELKALLKKTIRLQSELATSELADLFLNLIGPLQNEFLGPFVKKGQARIVELDRILGISSWREAFVRSRELDREVRRVIQVLEQRVFEHDKELDGLNNTLRALQSAESQLEERKEALEKNSAALAQVRAQCAAWEKLRTNLEEKEKELASAREKLGRLQVKREETEKVLVQARMASQICGDAARGHADFCAAETQLESLRSEERGSADLRGRIADANKSIVSVKSEIETETKNLSERKQRAEAQLAEIQTQLVSAKTRLAEVERSGKILSEKLNAYEGLAREMEETPAPATVRDAALRQIASLIAIAVESEELEQRLKQKPPLEALASREGPLLTDLNRLSRERATLEARIRQLKEGERKLASGQCPFFLEPCLNLETKRTAPANFFDEEIKTAEAQGRIATSKIDSLEAPLSEARQAARRLAGSVEVERQLAKLDRIRQKEKAQLEKVLQPFESGMLLRNIGASIESVPDMNLRKELNDLLRATDFVLPKHDNHLEDWRQAVETFSRNLQSIHAKFDNLVARRRQELNERVKELRAEWCELRERIRGAEKNQADTQRELLLVAQYQTLLNEKQTELQRRIIECEQLNIGMSGHADFSARITLIEEEKDKNRVAYLRFVANHIAASQAEKLEEEVRGLEEAGSEASAGTARLESEVCRLNSSYNRQRHAASREEQNLLTGKLAALSSEARALEKELGLLKEAENKSKSVRQELRGLREELRRYKKTKVFIEDLRVNVFDRVSQRLSQRFREEIGRLANRIYRAIASSDEELSWGEGYAIVLSDLANGQPRKRYDEELSGGQMMSAVVALRLALLQSTGCRIAFFDEPTSHLDEAHRANLAQAFRSLDERKGELGEPWYDQLFLISHDVSFTEITDQIIYLGEETT